MPSSLIKKYRVWTVSRGKLGPVDIQRSITAISYSSISLGAQKSSSWLSVMTNKPILLPWAIWLGWQHANTLYNYAPVSPVKVSRPYFSTRLQCMHEQVGLGIKPGITLVGALQWFSTLELITLKYFCSKLNWKYCTTELPASEAQDGTQYC